MPYNKNVEPEFNSFFVARAKIAMKFEDLGPKASATLLEVT